MNINFFIAKRIYSGKESNNKKVSLPAIKIAIAGVAIGLIVMILTVSVVLGFKHTIQNKVSDIGGDIQITSYRHYQMGDGTPIAFTDSISRVLNKIPNIESVYPYCDIQGILKTDSDFLGINFRSKPIPITSQRKQDSSAQQPSITVSKTIATKLGLKKGDKVYGYFIGESVRARKFTIDSIYETNLALYDKSLCFIPHNTIRKLLGNNDDQFSGIKICVSDKSQNLVTAQAINRQLKLLTDHYGEQYCTRTIQDVHPGIFAWLDLLDVNVWIILALMVCVAGITMISGLLIIILERTQLIGLLKALGARNGSVRHIFLWFASFIMLKGLIIGDIVSMAIILLQQATGIIQLDATSYYVDKVPMEINIPLFLLVNIATILICILVLILPSHIVSHISPSRSMRYE